MGNNTNHNPSDYQNLLTALKQTAELLEKTQQLAHVGGWEWDIRKKEMHWTNETYRIHDLDKDEIREKGYNLIEISFSCYLPEHVPVIQDAFNRCCSDGTSYDLEFPFVTAKGRNIWIKTIGNPVYDQGNIVRVSGNIIDITEQKQKDQSLKYSEMKFRAIIEQAAEMLFLHDMQGRIVDVNQAAMRQTGYTREELTGLTVFDIDPDAMGRLDPDNIWNSLSLNNEKTFEVRHRRKDGSVYPAEVTAGKIFFGNQEYILGMARDISERKAYEQARIDSERHANALIAAIPDMIFRMDANGVFLSYKASREDLFTDPEKFLGQHINTVLPENLASLTLEKIHTTIESNDIQIYEYELAIPEQGVMQFECRMVPYSDKEVVAIVRNITEQRKLEEVIREKEARYRLLIENQGEGIGVVDLNEKFIFANPAAEEIFGVAPGQLLDQKLLDFVAPEYIPIVERESSNRAKDGKTSYEIAIITSTGNRRNLLITATPRFNDKQEHIGAFGVFRDITERKQAEEQLRKSEQTLRELNATKDKFFSIIAHDLKGPFNAILGFSDILQERIREKDYADCEKFAGIIHNSSLNILNLLTNLLDWSRSQSGKMEFNPEYLEIGELIHEVVSILEDSVNRKSISLTCSVTRKFLVFADRVMISTVIRNLISNAIKFTRPEGQIIIACEQKQTEFIISVSDNGVGLKPESLDKLFRIDESYTTAGTQKEQGTGLGLILCKEFIDKHGGRIWAESEPGNGSRFFVMLPVK